MIDHFTFFCSESTGTVRHQSTILSVSNCRTEIGDWMLAEGAAFLFALRSITRNDNVSN